MNTMWKWILKYKTLLLVLLILVGWSAFFYFVPTDTLVESVGIGNSYLIAFGISTVAGFSLLTGSTAYAVVIEFARGGANPLWLGLISGTGLFLSDSGFYYLAVRGREAVEKRFSRWFTRIHKFITRMPDIGVYIGVYLFCAFGPIPNDVIMAALIISGYGYKKIWPYMLAGDLTFMLFLSYVFRS